MTVGGGEVRLVQRAEHGGLDVTPQPAAPSACKTEKTAPTGSGSPRPTFPRSNPTAWSRCARKRTAGWTTFLLARQEAHGGFVYIRRPGRSIARPVDALDDEHVVIEGILVDRKAEEIP